MKGWILALLLLLTLGGCSADVTAVTTTVPDALPVEQEVVEQTKPASQTSQPEKPTIGSRADCRANVGGPGSGVVG